jgi:PAS domain S-box-containing protein
MERAKSEKRHHFFFRHRLANEEIREVEVYSGPIRLHGKELLYSIIHDITERKWMEEALKESEAKLNAMLESIADPMSMMDKDLNILWANKTAMEFFGDDIIGKKCFEAYHQRQEPCEPYPCITLKAFQDGNIHEHNTQVVDKDGKTRHFHCTASVALSDDDGKPTAVIEISRNTTESVRAREALRDSNERFRELAELLPQPVFEIDLEGNFIYANHKGMKAFGYNKQDVEKGVNALELFIPEERERVKQNIRKKLTGEEFEDHEYIGLRKDGSTFSVLVYSAPIIRKNKPAGVRGIVLDISERKRAEEKIRQSKELFEKVFLTQQDALFILDATVPPKILDCNPAATEVFGYRRQEMLGITPDFLHVDETTIGKFREHVFSHTEKNGPIHLAEFEMKRKNGTVFPTEHTVMPLEDKHGECIGWVSVVRDISDTEQAKKETKTLEVKLLQAKKMEAIANLSSGVARELDNLFQTVQGYVEQLLWDRKKDDPIYQELLDITHAALRGARLTRKLLTFSGSADSKKRSVDLNQEVMQAQKLLGRTLPANIELELHLADDLKIINADPSQMEQILLALALNAKDALPEGGKITISTEGVTLDKQFCRTHPEAEVGESVMLTVSDTGHGIGQETIVHVFDPFYTKKNLDDGSGLGLSMVYGIVKNHGGFVLCFSESGVGTTFKIYLPATKKEAKLATRIEMEV